MTASPGSPTNSQIEFNVSNRRACCLDLWQSLWGCHRVQFLCISMMSLLLLVILRSILTPFCIHLALHWTVLTNLQTSFNAIQHSFSSLQLLLNTSKTKCMPIRPVGGAYMLVFGLARKKTKALPLWHFLVFMSAVK
ncbi:hypothetical protein J4Q44_G00369250 [Coregonus suidteri]|uniref:Uncharacterized protein n=1 Tax=Coregonus suidteri TaxID=861788 RepID=A0AAN8QAB3_9TELE